MPAWHLRMNQAMGKQARIQIVLIALLPLLELALAPLQAQAGPPPSPPPGAQAPPQPGAQTPPQPGAQAPPSAQAPGDVQVLLDRAYFSPGIIDGAWGENTHKAIAAFQEAHDLPVSGDADSLTWQNLLAASGNQVLTSYTITPEDEKGPFFQIPEDIMEKAKLPALGYRSLLEMLGGRFHCTEKLLRKLNPGARFAAGESIRVPNVRVVASGPYRSGTGTGAVRIVVSKAKLTLIVENGDDLLFFAPVTAGSEHDPLPLGQWKVRSINRNPAFHYNPALFWDANPNTAKAKIPPGPNNPAGSVWIDLSKEHYGIHGTPEPSKIGTTHSHGCVRLTNWDALTVASLVSPGTPVIFEP